MILLYKVPGTITAVETEIKQWLPWLGERDGRGLMEVEFVCIEDYKLEIEGADQGAGTAT